MTVQLNIARKGHKVVTVKSGISADQAVGHIKLERVGSLTVSFDRRSVHGLVSERDIVLAMMRSVTICSTEASTRS